MLITALGTALILIGLWGMLTRKNLIRIIIGFSIMDTGIHLVLVSLGYFKGRTAPIIDDSVAQAELATRAVDPIPSALVLTAIVIGLAVTALMLVYAVEMQRKKKSLNIEAFEELKW